jgi:hypothetical protein
LRHLWFALDFFAPLALFYGLIWSGFSLYFALLASAALSAISAVVSFVRGTSGQRFAPYMLALSLGAFGIALISGSDRFLLAKESILTAAVGCWFLASIWTDRPLTYVLTRPLLESAYGRKVGIFGPLTWEELWATDDSFRHIFKVSSVMWAGATMLDAVLRVVIAYTLPVSAVPGLHLALFVVTLLLMQVVTNVYYARSGLWTLIRDGGTQHHADSTQRKGTHHEPDNP